MLRYIKNLKSIFINPSYRCKLYYEFAIFNIVYSISEGTVKFNPNIKVKTLKVIESEPKGVQLIDVRNPEELEVDGRFPGATNIPLDQIETAFGLSDAEFQKKYGIPKPKPKDDNIVFACQVGARSYTACEILQKLGYERIFDNCCASTANMSCQSKVSCGILIQAIGSRARFSSAVIYRALIYMNQYYDKASAEDVPPSLLAITMLFIAGEVFDQHRALRNIIQAFYRHVDGRACQNEKMVKVIETRALELRYRLVWIPELPIEKDPSMILSEAHQRNALDEKVSQGSCRICKYIFILTDFCLELSPQELAVTSVQVETIFQKLDDKHVNSLIQYFGEGCISREKLYNKAVTFVEIYTSLDERTKTELANMPI